MTAADSSIPLGMPRLGRERARHLQSAVSSQRAPVFERERLKIRERYVISPLKYNELEVRDAIL